MPVLKSKLDPASGAFAANAQAMAALVEELGQKTAKAQQGGSERARERLRVLRHVAGRDERPAGDEHGVGQGRLLGEVREVAEAVAAA